MTSNPNDYYFSQETGQSQIPLNPVVRGLSTIQEAYASSSQSQSQSNNSQQMSVVEEGEEDVGKNMDDSFNHHVEEYYDHDPVNDLWLQEQEGFNYK